MTAAAAEQLWVRRYRLRAAQALNSRSAALGRSGALLRVRFAGIGIGHADLCPFPALADPPLAEQLRALAQGRPLPMGLRALHFAHADALARARGQALLDGERPLHNHWLVTHVACFDATELDALAAAGYRRIKLKLGRDLALEARLVTALLARLQRIRHTHGHDLRLRLDFNAQPTREQFCAWLDAVGPRLPPLLDFVEDPFPYSAAAWRAVAAGHGIRLALDLAADPLATGAEGADVVVVKPAVQHPQPILDAFGGGPKSIVFTHYMDSAFGQMCALHAAEQAGQGSRSLVHGLQQGPLFAPTALQSAVGADGPRIVPPAGTGFGFDAWLARQPWLPLGPAGG